MIAFTARAATIPTTVAPTAPIAAVLFSFAFLSCSASTSSSVSRGSLISLPSEADSSVSEENAASTQETNAAMEELNATFSLITESAGQLRVLANDLKENISFFTS